MYILIWMTSAFATTWTVGPSGADYTTIQAAIDGATTGDSIQVAAGTYTEALDLSGLNLNITAPSGAASTVLRSPATKTSVRWLLSEDGQLNGFTIEPSKARAFEIKGGAPTIQNCVVALSGSTSSPVNGGGGHIDNGTPTFDTVTFSENTGRYGGTLYAEGGASVELIDVTIADSGGSYGGALFAKSAAFTGQRVTISDAYADNSGGAIYLDDSVLDIDTLTIRNASGGNTWGAGIFARNGSTLTLINGLISGSYAANYTSGYSGGAIRLEGTTSTLNADGTTFDKNKGYQGGAISLAANTTATLLNVTLSNHEAHQAGGAIYVESNAQLTCEGCTIEDNAAPKGGGIYLNTGGSWTDRDGVFQRNQATLTGGAAHINAPSLFTTYGSTFTANQGDTGGALYLVTPGTSRIEATLFDQNQAATDGGALSITGGGIAYLSDVRFSDNGAQNGGALNAEKLDGLFMDWIDASINTATNNGGAMFVKDTEQAKIQRSHFVSNGAGANGGAWYEVDGATFSQFETTIWQENTAEEGGALYISGSQGTEMRNNTLAGNKGTSQGDHAVFLDTPIRFINNIAVNGVQSGAIYGDSATASTAVFWYNDLWNNTSGAYTGSLVDPTGSDGNIALDPLFRAYTLDGNATNDDFHLQSVSPCIDTGWSALKDVDGSPSDIGAFGGANPRLFDEDMDGYSDLIDCDDGNPDIYPGAIEIPYDGIDQDCNGQDWTDVDGDGYSWDGIGGTDCNDEDPAIHPNTDEIWYDGVDQNCDGLSDFDQDEDGYDADTYGGDDCNDTASSIHPGAAEVVNDGIDQDCDDTDAIDADGDGHVSKASGGDDCDDERAEAYPGAEEQYNSLDDDCDGYAETDDRDDDGLPDYVEWAWNTDPLNPDSDGDSLRDGQEGTPDEDPWDTDGDGWINPLDTDDDNDGIPTQVEAQLPDPDMDQDGLPAWLDKDTDGDGRKDATEGTGDQDLDGKPDYADFDGDYTGGCVGGKSVLFVFFVPLLFRRKTLHPALFLCLFGAAAFPTPSALAGGPDAHNLEWFNIGGPETGTLRVARPMTLAQGVALGGHLESAFHPLLEWTPQGTEPLIGQMTTLSLGTAFTFIDRLQFDILLPVHIDVQGTQGRRAGFGDTRVSSKYSVLTSKKSGLALSGQVLFWFPSGRAVLHHGSGAFATGGMIIVGQQLGLFHWSANLGARLGPQSDTRNIRSNQGPLAGLALGFEVTQDQHLFAEVVSQGATGWQQWPLEIGLGVTLRAKERIDSTVAFYVSPTEAAGVPLWRLSFATSWSKTKAKQEPIPPVVTSPTPPPKVEEAPKEQSPSPAVMADDRILIHQQIRFEEGSAKLMDKGDQPVLFSVLSILAKHPDIQHLLIIGHTNHHGSPEVNQQLSEARASSVAEWFIRHGVSNTRLLHKGYGSSQPKVHPNHPDSDIINRRVEFKVLRE